MRKLTDSDKDTWTTEENCDDDHDHDHDNYNNWEYTKWVMHNTVAHHFLTAS